MQHSCFSLSIMALLAALLALPAQAQTRNAAFINPNTVSGKPGEGKLGGGANTLVADPLTIDAGETLVNVARRITVFFYNGFRAPVTINELTLNADGNVRSKVVSDDCKTIKTLPVGDKCSVALEITPSSPGPWSVELLQNHSGLGRISRAEVTGSTLGKADGKSEGLAISKKIAAPLDFGSVIVNEEKAARTMLIENDSTTPLIISSIDLIATEGEGLSLRDVGCKEGEELKAGESCPITVMWEPRARGNVATDLIVRHSGNLGFVIVPIRGAGSATEESKMAETGDAKPVKSTSSTKPRASSGSGSLVPRSSSAEKQQAIIAPPALDTLPLPQKTQEIVTQIEPINSNVVLPKTKEKPVKEKRIKQVVQEPQDVQESGDDQEVEAAAAPELVLIGTVGGRAILGDADGQSYMVGLGEKASISGTDVELLQLDPTRVVVSVAGLRTNLSLRNAPSIMHKKEGSANSSSRTSEVSVKEDKRKSESIKSDPLDGSMPVAPASQTTPASTTGLPSGLTPLGSLFDNKTSGGLTAQDVLNLVR